MVAKTLSEGNLILDHRLVFLMVASLVASGCFPTNERIVKVNPKFVVATVNEGHYEVQAFLIDGEPPTEGMMRMPGSEINVSVTFTRKWDVPDNVNLTAIEVIDTKGSDMTQSGSHLVSNQYEIPSRPGKVTQTVDFKIPLLDSTAANYAEEGGLGRYCRIILAEAKSEIVSHKILIAKE